MNLTATSIFEMEATQHNSMKDPTILCSDNRTL